MQAGSVASRVTILPVNSPGSFFVLAWRSINRLLVATVYLRAATSDTRNETVRSRDSSPFSFSLSQELSTRRGVGRHTSTLSFCNSNLPEMPATKADTCFLFFPTRSFCCITVKSTRSVLKKDSACLNTEGDACACRGQGLSVGTEGSPGI